MLNWVWTRNLSFRRMCSLPVNRSHRRHTHTYGRIHAYQQVKDSFPWPGTLLWLLRWLQLTANDRCVRLTRIYPNSVRQLQTHIRWLIWIDEQQIVRRKFRSLQLSLFFSQRLSFPRPKFRCQHFYALSWHTRPYTLCSCCPSLSLSALSLHTRYVCAALSLSDW